MSRKSARIALLIESCRGGRLDPYYLGYFECFNQRLFYEAHDVLEELWLPERGRPNARFFQGLIQLAGAFVHLQKGRLKPADALFALAEKNLRLYPARHESLDVSAVLALIGEWRESLAARAFLENPYTPEAAPKLAIFP